MSNPVGAQRYGLGGGDAYYDAVKYGGYTGTREQFGRDQAEFAQNATAVAQAKEEVERNTQTVVNTAQTFTEETVPAAIQSVEEKGDTEEDRLEARTTELVEAVNTAGAVQVQAVEDEGGTQVQRVTDAGSDAAEAIQQVGSDQVDAVEQAGSTQVGNVNSAGTTQVENVNQAGTTQVGNVNTAGAAQVQAVEDKGEEVRESIPADYTELVETVDSLQEEYIAIAQSDVRSGVWENGQIVSWGVRLCLKTAIPVKKGDRVRYNSGSLQLLLGIYQEGSTSLTGNTGWQTATEEAEFIAPVDGNFVFNVRKTDNTSIAVSDYDCTVKVYSNFMGHFLSLLDTTKEDADDKITDLKSGLITVDDFEYGNYNVGIKITTSDSRFRTKTRHICTVPLTIIPKLNFQWNANYYDSQTKYIGGSGWKTEAFTIPANTIFTLVLADVNNTYKNASYLSLIYDAFTFEYDSLAELENKSDHYSTNIVPLTITDEMKGWSYYIGAGSNNHQTETNDFITFAVPMSKGDYVRIKPNFAVRVALANYSNGSLDDRSTCISTENRAYMVGEDLVVVDDDYTVFLSVRREPAAATGDYSDFPDGIEINLCPRNYIKMMGFDSYINAEDVQSKAFVSSYNDIEWEAHAQNFAEMFNGKTNCDSFLFFTDCHIMHMSNAADRANLMWQPRVRKALSYIEQLFYATPCNTLLMGGDWLGSNDTQAQALYMLSYINGAMRKKFQDHFAMVLGNHDTNYQGYINSESATVDGRLTQGAINATYCSGHDKSYFVYHAPTYDVYCFDSGIESSNLTSSYYTDQVKWFATALESNNAAHIVIFIHMIYNNGSTLTYGALFDELTKCAKAYNDRSIYTYDGVSHDYSGKTGKVAFALGGHIHADSTGTKNDIPFAITRNASGFGNFTTLPLDLGLIDWDNNKLYLYRAEIGQTTGNIRELTIISQ